MSDRLEAPLVSICHVSVSALLIGRSRYCQISNMAATLVEHVVADAGAFLKRAPLQVRLHSSLNRKYSFYKISYTTVSLLALSDVSWSDCREAQCREASAHHRPADQYEVKHSVLVLSRITGHNLPSVLRFIFITDITALVS